MIKETEIIVKDYQLVSHLNMAKVHKSVYSGVFECEGKPLHGKKFIQETNVEVKGFMEYGDTTSIFYLEGEDIFFESGEEMVKHYNR